jgi:glycolate oxidase FAD binding subunit
MPLTPVAVELDWPSRQLVAVFESSEPSAHAQATEVAQEFGASVDEALPDWFGQHPWGDGDVGLKISTTTTGVAAAIRAISELADGEARVRGRAAVGVLEVAVPSIDAESLARLRTALAGYDGSAVVVQALPEVKREIDVWGPVGNSLELMRRVKHRFDPEGRLSPGRFVGGI